jgi:hypothetical protein
MAGPSKNMCVWWGGHIWTAAREYSDIYKSEYSSDGEISVKILPCSEQSVSSDEEENVSDE